MLLGSILAGSGVRALEPVPTVPPPKSWENFVVLVWQFQTELPRDKALYESVNLKGFHIDYVDPRLQTFAKESGWPYYVDHAARKGYLHLRDKDVDPIMAQFKKSKQALPRPNSLADPKTVETMKANLKASIGAAKGGAAVAYAYDDEISTGSFASPVETDAGPQGLAYYRKYLKELYGEIGRLNEQYGTSHASFDAIGAQSYEQFRKALQPAGLGKVNLSAWCDWRSANDSLFAETIADLTRYANEQDPGVPAGAVGLGTPAAFGGYDYRKITKAMQWMEAYDIGGSNELLRSFWGQKRPHVQTFFSSKDPKKDTWFLWYYLVHGDRGVICWPEGWFKNGEVAPYIKPLAETFKEVQGPVSKHVVDAEFAHDPVAIYYSHPSVQATWALDAATHGGTWVNRSSSMENSHGTCSLTRVAWLKTLEDLGIQGRFIHQDHLLDGVLAKDKYKVLLLPRVVCLSDEEAKAIRAFAEAGGTVLADQLCGVFDEHGKSRAKGALDDLFGVKRDLSKGILNGQTLTEVDCEKGYKGLDEKNWTHGELFKGLAVFEPGLAADGGEALDKAGEVPVRVKKGSAVCLNLSPIGYMLTRAKAGNPEWLAFVSGILKDAGVTPRVALKVNGEAPRMVETLFWKNGEKTTFCVIRNIERKASITGFGSSEGDVGDGAVKLTFTFAKAVKGLKNERTGKELGDGAEFSDDWTPWEANVYTFTP